MSELFWRQISAQLERLVYSAKATLKSTFDMHRPDTTPVVLLGLCYDSPSAEFLLDHMSKVWMTYRSGYPTIHPTAYTSDVGWGCMLRSGQMLLCNAFILQELGRSWRLEDSGNVSTYIHVRSNN